MSVARLEVVNGMELTPQACMLCGSNPVDETTGKQMPAIFAPGVDYDWGSSAYICWSCAEIIADLLDRPTQDGWQKLQDKMEALEEEHGHLLNDHKRAQGLLERIGEGKKAVKEIKAAKTGKGN